MTAIRGLGDLRTLATRLLEIHGRPFASGVETARRQEFERTAVKLADLVLAHGAILPLQRDGYDDEELGS